MVCIFASGIMQDDTVLQKEKYRKSGGFGSGSIQKLPYCSGGGKGDSRIVTSKELIEAFVRETEVAYPYYDDIDG